MPESGFFTSCASTAAMPVTARAAPLWVRERSIFEAMVRSSIWITTEPGCSTIGESWILTVFTSERGVPSRTPYSEIAPIPSRAWRNSDRSGLPKGAMSLMV
jgi:hypothetical protein